MHHQVLTQDALAAASLHPAHLLTGHQALGRACASLLPQHALASLTGHENVPPRMEPLGWVHDLFKTLGRQLLGSTCMV